MPAKIVLLLCVVLLPMSTVVAEECNEEVFQYDQALPEFSSMPFYRDKKLSSPGPERSDFVIVRQVLMSNCKGRRMAVVSIKNIATGRRFLQREHIVAVFANGFMGVPHMQDKVLRGGEELNFTIDFGVYRFPILYLATVN